MHIKEAKYGIVTVMYILYTDVYCIYSSVIFISAAKPDEFTCTANKN